jgi:hypothetical protein
MWLDAYKEGAGPLVKHMWGFKDSSDVAGCP